MRYFANVVASAIGNPPFFFSSFVFLSHPLEKQPFAPCAERLFAFSNRQHALKSEARISKYETNPNDQNSNVQNTTTVFRSFEHSDFDIVSNFDIRISDFVPCAYCVVPLLYWILMNASVRCLALLLVLSVSVALVHTNGIARGWYWKYPWLDLPMHFFGGVIICLLVRWWSERVWGIRLPFMIVILSVFFVGVGWEVFEYALGLIEVPRDVYIKDTAIDLLLDTLGGGMAARLFTAKSP